MAISLDSIKKGVQHRPPRIVLMGAPKIGKTTFAASMESPIFIPIKGEEGADDLDVASFPPANSFQDVLDCLGTLYQGEHEYSTVVIDSASALEPLVWAAVCEAHKVDMIEKVLDGYGKGYLQALNHWRMILEGLDALRSDRNMGCCLIGHVKIKDFRPPDGDAYTRFWMDINEKAYAVIERWADCILFANSKTVVKKEDAGFNKKVARAIDTTNGARFLYTQARPAHPGGGRGIYGRLPYELPLDYDTFIEAVATAANQ